MAAAREVKMTVVADASQAVKELAKTDTALAKTEKSMASTSKEAKNLGTIGFDEVKKKLSNLADNIIPGGGKAFDHLTQNMNSGKDAALQLAGPAALGAVITVGVKTVGMVQDLAQEVLRFQRVAGTSAEESSKFVEVMSDYGVSAEQGANAIGKFAKNVQMTPKAFEDLGVQIVKTKDGSVDLEATLMKAADVFASTTDETKRAELGTKLFGKTWQDLIPILDKGSTGIKKAFDNVDSGKIFTQQQVNDSEALRLAVDDLRDKGESLALMIGKSLVPALKDLATTAGTVGDVVNTKAVGSIIQFLSKASLVPGAMAFIESQTSNAGAATLDYAEAIGGPLMSASNNMTKAQIDAADVQDYLTKKVAEGEAADKAATAAVNDRQRGEEGLHKALLQRFADADAAVNRDLALTNADVAVRQGQRDLKTALDDVAKAHNDGGKAADDFILKQTEVVANVLTATKAYAEQKGARDGTAESAEIQIQKLKEEKDAFGENYPIVRAEIDKQIASLQALAEAARVARIEMQNAGQAVAGYEAGVNVGGGVKVRAAGGPVAAGTPYIVGEVGPELFVPNQSGMIIPNNKLSSSAGSGGGGGGVTIIVQGSVIDGKGLIDALATGKRIHPAAFAQLVA